MRELVFAACARKRIPATTVAPLGMGAALLNFVPGGMSFDDYFGFSGRTEEQQALRFLVGLSPSMLQMGYLADPSRVNLAERRGPSTIIAVQLCSGIAAAQVLKRTWRPGGHRNPLQRLLLSVAERRLQAT
jgi:hypothetical protein